MLHFPRWKIIAILLSILVSAVLALPNVLPKDQQAVVAKYGLRPMTLGLDLQGGSNVLLEVDRKDLAEQLQTQMSSDIRGKLREAKIAYSNISRTGGGVSVRITKPEDMDRAKTALQSLVTPESGGLFQAAPVNVYELQTNDGGYTLALTEAGVNARIARAINQSLKIVESRINALGTTEPVIQQQGVDRIVVQLPGLQDPDSVIGVIGRTAKLSFQLLCEDQQTTQGQTPPPDCRAYPFKEDVDAAELEKGKAQGLSKPVPLNDDEKQKLPRKLWVKTSSAATVDGADLTDAAPTFGENNQPVVSFKFNLKGATRFANLTRENVNKPFAIVLDGVVQSAPNINMPILGGSGYITGNFTTQETAALAVVLKSGALPAKLDIVEQRTVGPSLGADSVRAGFISCAIGLFAVMFFMLLPYGFFGVVADVALVVNLLMLLAIMSFFGFTLTLPGIAGILLTLGMAVDSNVLIYERIREEWRNGRTAVSALETGFKQALSTVVDANVTTLIAAFVLFGIGSGPVRGFAVTLAIGIMTTMFTAFTLTRMIVGIWMRRTRPKEINL